MNSVSSKNPVTICMSACVLGYMCARVHVCCTCVLGYTCAVRVC